MRRLRAPFHTLAICGALAATAMPAVGAGAQSKHPVDKDVQISVWLRDPGLSKVRHIAILPPAVMLTFSGKGRMPDSHRFAIRRAIAGELPHLLKVLIQEQGGGAVVEQAAAAMAASGLRPVDLFGTASGAGQELIDEPGNLCRLALAEAALADDPVGATVFYYEPAERRPLGKGFYGLAVVTKDAGMRGNIANLRQIAQRLKTDALLVLRVEDIDIRGTLLEGFKSVWITVRAALFSAPDCIPLLDATFKTNAYGKVQAHALPRFGERWENSEHELALKAMARLAPALVRRLLAED